MGRRLDPEEALRWAVAEPRTAVCATTRRDGRPHVAPVWVALDGDRLVFMTGAETVKGRSLRRDPRVALCFDDESPPFGFVVVEGTAELSEDLDELVRWGGVIGGRYMGEDRGAEFARRNGVPGELLVVVTPTSVVGELRVAD